MKRKYIWLSILGLLGCIAVGLVFAGPTFLTGKRGPGNAILGLPASVFQSETIEMEGPLVSDLVYPTLSIAARDLPEVQPDVLLEREVNPRQNPLQDILFPNIVGPVDPLLGLSQEGNTTQATPILTFDGTDNFCGCSPPDTVGDVGPNHYVQMVNATVFNVYDKNGNVILANHNLNDLWASGNCSVSDVGDPIVVYDGLANRWVLAQFSTGNGICVAVSQTGDPTGAYYGYEFTTPSFPDYFKIGVWPNAYYVSANESSYSALALDRTKMLAGQAATSIRFAGQTNLLMPADVDGPTGPVSNADGIFYTFKDNATHGGNDRIELFAFHPDFTTPANSTFTTLSTLNLTSFTYTVCGFFNLNCVPQAGTGQKVDAVSEWPMYRLVYRNFGDHQTLLGNFTVDVGSDRAGIRWFELRNTSGTWSLYQEGTFSLADTIHRFMGSITMDGDGNIALGYSRSSSSLNPSIYYVTRLSTDPLGTFGPEELMYAGAGSQTSSDRWGDYSAISIDPSDDCTFWYTQEYYPSNSGNNWNTRVGKFILPSCGQGGTSTPTPTATNTPTSTPTSTPTGSLTPSSTPSPTATNTSTSPTATPSPILTNTPEPTATPTGTQTPPKYKLYFPIVSRGGE
ncbi:MAG TPA: hypothetical protein PK530_08005 [Anaerolineales bacterium]|nr:hypothetical protein [Anaerolineales bacterium]